MSFSDEDLERVENVIRFNDRQGGETVLKGNELKALLARLRAAEKALNLCEFDPNATNEQISEALKAWLDLDANKGGE